MKRDTTARFTIEGEFLTDLCRSLVLEGRWRDGLTTLVNSLQGISTDQALSVLKGSHKLTGENDLDLVEEDRSEAEDYRQTLAWQYAGLWFRPTVGNWLPYAVVGSLGRADVPTDMLFPDPVPGLAGRWVDLRELDRWSRLRLLYYADNPKADTATREEAGPILWKPAEDPPLWLEGSRDSGAALAGFLAAGRRLEERGPATEGASPPWRIEDAGHSLGELAETSEAMDVLCEDPRSPADYLIGRLGLTGKMAEAAEVLLMSNEDDSRPEPDAELCSESGYILPDGSFFGCKYMHHPHLAKRLLRQLFDVEVDDPQMEADRRNWLRIQAGVFGGFKIMSPKNRPTKRQEITLASWCVAHLQPYPEDLK